MKLRKERKQLDRDKKEFELKMMEYTMGGPKLRMKLWRYREANKEFKKVNTALNKEARYLRTDLEVLMASMKPLKEERDALLKEKNKNKPGTTNGQRPTPPTKRPYGDGSKPTDVTASSRIKIRKTHVDLSGTLYPPLQPANPSTQDQQATSNTTKVPATGNRDDTAEKGASRGDDPQSPAVKPSPDEVEQGSSTDRLPRIRNTIAMLNKIKNNKRLSEASSNGSSVSPAGPNIAASIKPQTSKAGVKSSPAKHVLQPSPSKVVKTTTATTPAVKKTIFKKAPTNAAKTKTKSAADTTAAHVQNTTPAGSPPTRRSSRRQQEKKPE